MDWQLDELIRQLAELNCRLKRASQLVPTPTGDTPATPPGVSPGQPIPAPRNGDLSLSSPLGPPTYPPPAKNGVAIFSNSRTIRVRTVLGAGNINSKLVDADGARRILYFNGYGSSAFLNVRAMSAIEDGWLIGNSAANGLLLFDSIDSSVLCESEWHAFNNAVWAISIIEAW